MGWLVDADIEAGGRADSAAVREVTVGSVARRDGCSDLATGCGMDVSAWDVADVDDDAETRYEPSVAVRLVC